MIATRMKTLSGLEQSKNVSSSSSSSSSSSTISTTSSTKIPAASLSREERLQSMMANGQLHEDQYRKTLERDAEADAKEDDQLEELQSKVLQMDDGIKPDFIQKLSAEQYGVGNGEVASLEENMRRKRASQQVGDDYMNEL